MNLEDGLHGGDGAIDARAVYVVVGDHADRVLSRGSAKNAVARKFGADIGSGGRAGVVGRENAEDHDIGDDFARVD